MIYLPEDRLKIYTHSLQAIKKGSPERYRHLVNSLSLYNAAIHASRNGQAAAIVLLVAALEALLEIPRGARKAETFAHSASLLWGFSKRVQVRARQLYETRSTIVHGSVPKEEQLYASPEKHQSVLTLAKEFYEVSLLLRLEAQGFVTWEEEAKFAELESFVHKLESNKKKIEALEARKEALSFETVSPEGSEHYRELIGRIESLSYFDLTGSERIPAVLGIISDIAIPWIEKTIVDCRERLECLENDANARKHLSWYLEQLERVKGAFDKTLGVELSASPTFEERMQWKQAIHELQEEIRRLYPVVPDRTRFAYHLEEFLTRTITPVFLLRL